MRRLSLKTERLDADALRELIMQHAAEKALDSAVVVEALAQVLALVAAQNDVRGIGGAFTIEERMKTLGERVEELHAHWLACMGAIATVGSGN